MDQFVAGTLIYMGILTAMLVFMAARVIRPIIRRRRVRRMLEQDKTDRARRNRIVRASHRGDDAA